MSDPSSQTPSTEPLKEPSSGRLVGVLTAVCAVSALLVALTLAVTARPIEKAKAEAHAAMLRQVLPEGAGEPVRLTAEKDGESFEYYSAHGAIAIEVETARGYAGKIRLLVGFDRDGTLYSFKVLEHSETPGLGANLAVADNSVLSSARGKPANGTRWSVTKDGGDIHALTAATISSRAACEALSLAANRVAGLLEKVP